MRITDKQLNLLADVIVKQVFDEEAYSKQIQDELEAQRQKFRKENKDYQKFLKLLKDNPIIKGITVKSEFFWKGNGSYYYNSYVEIRENENDARVAFTQRLRDAIDKPTRPDTFKIKQDVLAQLTVKALGGENVEKMIQEIAKEMKKKYNL